MKKYTLSILIILTIIVWLLLIIDLALGSLVPWYIQPVIIGILFILLLLIFFRWYVNFKRSWKFYKLAKIEIKSTIIKICTNCSEKKNFKRCFSCKQLICMNCDLMHQEKCKILQNKFDKKLLKN